jgi:type IV pilus assembly protein PilQ
MLNPLRLVNGTLRRGALVLAFACIFATFTEARAASLVTGVRATTEGAVTRITVAASAPLAYGVRRADARTLTIELPGADARGIATSYSVTSPLASGINVLCASGANGQPNASLRVALLAPVRERSYLSGSELVLELTPENGGAQTAVLSEMNASAALADAPQQQQQPARPVVSATPARNAAGTPSDQGKHYGEYGFVGEPINLNVVNADISDILNYITEQYGVNFIIDKSVKDIKVTVNVTDVPWNVALDAILRANRLGISVEGNILRVATIETLADEAASQEKVNEGRLNAAPLVTEFVRLNYARAVGTLAQAAGSTGGFAGGSSNQSFSGGSGGDATGKSGDQGILPIISRRLSKRGSVEVDGRSNTLIITDVKDNIDAIRTLVSLLDQPEPQVEIEARIVIANRNFSRDLGVQISALALGSRGSGGSIATTPGSPDSNASSGGSGGSSGTNTTGFRPGGIPVGIGLEPTRGLGANAASTVIGLTTGIIGTAQISALITAAETKGQAKIVATPRVTVLNNRPAQIESGSQIPVVSPQGGGATGGAVVFTTTFISVPLRLSITPQITDAGTVVLRVVAENNSVNLSLTNSLGTPGIDTQRMQTEVLVPDGGTTVVGGVLADNEGETQARTPGISGIPIIGNLFKRKATTRTTNELLFFITPRIYRPDYQGRPMNGTVSDHTRSTTIPQPVPLGNPQSNTPPPVGSGQQQQPNATPANPSTTVPPPSARPEGTSGERPQGGN